MFIYDEFDRKNIMHKNHHKLIYKEIEILPPNIEMSVGENTLYSETKLENTGYNIYLLIIS